MVSARIVLAFLIAPTLSMLASKVVIKWSLRQKTRDFGRFYIAATLEIDGTKYTECTMDYPKWKGCNINGVWVDAMHKSGEDWAIKYGWDGGHKTGTAKFISKDGVFYPVRLYEYREVLDISQNDNADEVKTEVVAKPSPIKPAPKILPEKKMAKPAEVKTEVVAKPSPIKPVPKILPERKMAKGGPPVASPGLATKGKIVKFRASHTKAKGKGKRGKLNKKTKASREDEAEEETEDANNYGKEKENEDGEEENEDEEDGGEEKEDEEDGEEENEDEEDGGEENKDEDESDD